MDGTIDVVFWIMSAGAIGAALLVVTVKDVFRAALALAGSFLAVAGIFFLLQAEFVAVAQILVYVGAISIIVAFAILDKSSGDLTSGPDLLQRGFLNPEDDDMLDDAANYAMQAVANLSPKERHNLDEVSETIRASIRRFFRKRLDRKPVVIPIIHEM